MPNEPSQQIKFEEALQALSKFANKLQKVKLSKQYSNENYEKILKNIEHLMERINETYTSNGFTEEEKSIIFEKLGSVLTNIYETCWDICKSSKEYEDFLNLSFKYITYGIASKFLPWERIAEKINEINQYKDLAEALGKFKNIFVRHTSDLVFDKLSQEDPKSFYDFINSCKSKKNKEILEITNLEELINLVKEYPEKNIFQKVFTDFGKTLEEKRNSFFTSVPTEEADILLYMEATKQYDSTSESMCKYLIKRIYENAYYEVNDKNPRASLKSYTGEDMDLRKKFVIDMLMTFLMHPLTNFRRYKSMVEFFLNLEQKYSKDFNSKDKSIIDDLLIIKYRACKTPNDINDFKQFVSYLNEKYLTHYNVDNFLEQKFSNYGLSFRFFASNDYVEDEFNNYQNFIETCLSQAKASGQTIDKNLMMEFLEIGINHVGKEGRQAGIGKDTKVVSNKAKRFIDFLVRINKDYDFPENTQLISLYQKILLNEAKVLDYEVYVGGIENLAKKLEEILGLMPKSERAAFFPLLFKEGIKRIMLDIHTWWDFKENLIKIFNSLNKISHGFKKDFYQKFLVETIKLYLSNSHSHSHSHTHTSLPLIEAIYLVLVECKKEKIVSELIETELTSFMETLYQRHLNSVITTNYSSNASIHLNDLYCKYINYAQLINEKFSSLLELESRALSRVLKTPEDYKKIISALLNHEQKLNIPVINRHFEYLIKKGTVSVLCSIHKLKREGKLSEVQLAKLEEISVIALKKCPLVQSLMNMQGEEKFFDDLLQDPAGLKNLDQVVIQYTAELATLTPPVAEEQKANAISRACRAIASFSSNSEKDRATNATLLWMTLTKPSANEFEDFMNGLVKEEITEKSTPELQKRYIINNRDLPYNAFIDDLLILRAQSLKTLEEVAAFKAFLETPNEPLFYFVHTKNTVKDLLIAINKENLQERSEALVALKPQLWSKKFTDSEKSRVFLDELSKLKKIIGLSDAKVNNHMVMEMLRVGAEQVSKPVIYPLNELYTYISNMFSLPTKNEIFSESAKRFLDFLKGVLENKNFQFSEDEQKEIFILQNRIVMKLANEYVKKAAARYSDDLRNYLPLEELIEYYEFCKLNRLEEGIQGLFDLAYQIKFRNSIHNVVPVSIKKLEKAELKSKTEFEKKFWVYAIEKELESFKFESNATSLFETVINKLNSSEYNVPKYKDRFLKKVYENYLDYCIHLKDPQARLKAYQRFATFMLDHPPLNDLSIYPWLTQITKILDWPEYTKFINALWNPNIHKLKNFPASLIKVLEDQKSKVLKLPNQYINFVAGIVNLKEKIKFNDEEIKQLNQLVEEAERSGIEANIKAIEVLEQQLMDIKIPETIDLNLDRLKDYDNNHFYLSSSQMLEEIKTNLESLKKQKEARQSSVKESLKQSEIVKRNLEKEIKSYLVKIFDLDLKTKDEIEALTKKHHAHYATALKHYRTYLETIHQKQARFKFEHEELIQKKNHVLASIKNLNERGEKGAQELETQIQESFESWNQHILKQDEDVKRQLELLLENFESSTSVIGSPNVSMKDQWERIRVLEKELDDLNDLNKSMYNFPSDHTIALNDAQQWIEGIHLQDKKNEKRYEEIKLGYEQTLSAREQDSEHLRAFSIECFKQKEKFDTVMSTLDDASEKKFLDVQRSLDLAFESMRTSLKELNQQYIINTKIYNDEIVKKASDSIVDAKSSLKQQDEILNECSKKTKELNELLVEKNRLLVERSSEVGKILYEKQQVFVELFKVEIDKKNAEEKKLTDELTAKEQQQANYEQDIKNNEIDTWLQEQINEYENVLKGQEASAIDLGNLDTRKNALEKIMDVNTDNKSVAISAVKNQVQSIKRQARSIRPFIENDGSRIEKILREKASEHGRAKFVLAIFGNLFADFDFIKLRKKFVQEYQALTTYSHKLKTVQTEIKTIEKLDNPFVILENEDSTAHQTKINNFIQAQKDLTESLTDLNPPVLENFDKDEIESAQVFFKDPEPVKKSDLSTEANQAKKDTDLENPEELIIDPVLVPDESVLSEKSEAEAFPQMEEVKEERWLGLQGVLLIKSTNSLIQKMKIAQQQYQAYQHADINLKKAQNEKSRLTDLERDIKDVNQAKQSNDADLKIVQKTLKALTDSQKTFNEKIQAEQHEREYQQEFKRYIEQDLPVNTILNENEMSSEKTIHFIRNLVKENPQWVNQPNLDGLTPLHLAVKKGDLAMVKALKELNADLNVKDHHGKTPLWYAFADHQKAIVDYLKQEKADGHINDMTPLLIEWVKANNVEAIKWLFEHEDWISFNKNAQQEETSSKPTLLQMAIQNGSIDVINLLLNKGAEINATDNKDYHPLHYAVRQGSLDILNILLGHDSIYLNTVNSEGNAPLYYAARHKPEDKSFEFMTLLLDKGASLNVRNKEGELPLDLKTGTSFLYFLTKAGKFSLMKRVIEEAKIPVTSRLEGQPSLLFLVHSSPLEKTLKDQMMNYLISKGAVIDMTEKDKQGNTLLHLMAKEGNVNNVKKFTVFAKGTFWNDTNVNEPNHLGETPLHLAVALQTPQHLEIIQYLLSKDANVNLKNNAGNTPLHLAIAAGYIESVKLLLNDKNVDVNLQNENGDTPLHLALKAGHLDIVQLLLNHKNIDVNLKNKQAELPIHIAAEKGFPLVSHLIEKGSYINHRNNRDNTPLHLALEHGHTDRAKELLNLEKIKVNFQNRDGHSPLHSAIIKRSPLILELLKKGALINQTNPNNFNTPLHLAVSQAAQTGRGTDISLAKLLLGKGARCDLKNKSGQTPFDTEGGRGIFAKILGSTFDMKSDDVEKISNQGGGNDLLYLAIKQHNFELCHRLVEQGKVDLDRKDGHGYTLLGLLSDSLNFEGLHTPCSEKEIELLLGSQKVPNQQEQLMGLKDHSKRIVLIKYLIEKNAKFYQPQDPEGNNFLHLLAAQSMDEELIRNLVEQMWWWALIKDEVINAKNSHGKTLLHLAVDSGNIDLVDFLIKKGARLDIVDQDRNTPFNTRLGQNMLFALRGDALTEQSASLLSKIKRWSNSGRDSNELVKKIEDSLKITEEQAKKAEEEEAEKSKKSLFDGEEWKGYEPSTEDSMNAAPGSAIQSSSSTKKYTPSLFDTPYIESALHEARTPLVKAGTNLFDEVSPEPQVEVKQSSQRSNNSFDQGNIGSVSVPSAIPSKLASTPQPSSTQVTPSVLEKTAANQSTPTTPSTPQSKNPFDNSPSADINPNYNPFGSTDLPTTPSSSTPSGNSSPSNSPVKGRGSQWAGLNSFPPTDSDSSDASPSDSPRGRKLYSGSSSSEVSPVINKHYNPFSLAVPQEEAPLSFDDALAQGNYVRAKELMNENEGFQKKNNFKALPKSIQTYLAAQPKDFQKEYIVTKNDLIIAVEKSDSHQVEAWFQKRENEIAELKKKSDPGDVNYSRNELNREDLLHIQYEKDVLNRQIFEAVTLTRQGSTLLQQVIRREQIRRTNEMGWDAEEAKKQQENRQHDAKIARILMRYIPKTQLNMAEIAPVLASYEVVETTSILSPKHDENAIDAYKKPRFFPETPEEQQERKSWQKEFESFLSEATDKASEKFFKVKKGIAQAQEKVVETVTSPQDLVAVYHRYYEVTEHKKGLRDEEKYDLSVMIAEKVPTRADLDEQFKKPDQLPILIRYQDKLWFYGLTPTNLRFLEPLKRPATDPVYDSLLPEHGYNLTVTLNEDKEADANALQKVFNDKEIEDNEFCIYLDKRAAGIFYKVKDDTGSKERSGFISWKNNSDLRDHLGSQYSDFLYIVEGSSEEDLSEKLKPFFPAILKITHQSATSPIKKRSKEKVPDEIYKDIAALKGHRHSTLPADKRLNEGKNLTEKMSEWIKAGDNFKKADIINTRDKDGNTLLHLAVRDNLDIAVEWLLPTTIGQDIQNWFQKVANEVGRRVATIVIGSTISNVVGLVAGGVIGTTVTAATAMTGPFAIILGALAAKGTQAVAGHIAGTITTKVIDAVDNSALKKLEERIDVKHVNHAGETPLHIAAATASEKNLWIMAALLAQAETKDLDMMTHAGETSLHIAVRHRNTHIVALLILQGVNIDLQDAAGRTPLHQAIIVGDETLFEMIMESGADITLETHLGQTASMLLERKLADVEHKLEHPTQLSIDVQSALLEEKERYERMKIVLKTCEQKLPKQLKAKLRDLAKSVSPIEKNKQTWWNDIQPKAKQRAEELADAKGNMLLHVLVQDAGNLKAVEMLLSDYTFNADDLNKPNSEGNTPLHLAVRAGGIAGSDNRIRSNEKMVRLLIEKGANKDVKNNEGKKPEDLVSTNKVHQEKMNPIFKLR